MWKTIMNLLRSLFSSEKGSVYLIKRCPVCHGSYRGSKPHEYFVLADTAELKKRDELLDDLLAHRWQDARRYRDFDPQRAVIPVWAFRCPTGGVGILAYLDEPQLSSSDLVFHEEVLSAQDAARFLDAVQGENWKTLSP
jgi:hypothetical protein